MIRHLSTDEKVCQEAYYREKRLHDEANALGGARKEGLEEGREAARIAIAEKRRTKGVSKQQIKAILS